MVIITLPLRGREWRLARRSLPNLLPSILGYAKKRGVAPTAEEWFFMRIRIEIDDKGHVRAQGSFLVGGVYVTRAVRIVGTLDADVPDPQDGGMALENLLDVVGKAQDAASERGG